MAGRNSSRRGSNVQIVTPETNSGLGEILQRYSDGEIHHIVNSITYNVSTDTIIIEIGRVLRRAADKFDQGYEPRDETNSPIDGTLSERARETLRRLSIQFTERYAELSHDFEAWKGNREKLIEILGDHALKLDRNFKYATVVRLCASAVDVTGSVGGLLLKSESEWVDKAFRAATYCGLLGLVSTVVEVERSKRILDDLSANIEKDQDLFEPVKVWFKQTEELDRAVQEVFPYGISLDIVQQIQEASGQQDAYLKLFKAALASNVRRDVSLFRDQDFLHSLHLFASSDIAPVWWNRIIHREHPIHLEIAKMSLQAEFGQIQSIIFQSIPALPLEQQRLLSLPVAGRIMLNCLTMYDSWNYLSDGAKSSHSGKIRRLLQEMTAQLHGVSDIVQIMRPRNFVQMIDNTDHTHTQ